MLNPTGRVVMVSGSTRKIGRAGWERGIRPAAVYPGFADADMPVHVQNGPRLPNTAGVAELLDNWRQGDTL